MSDPDDKTKPALPSPGDKNDEYERAVSQSMPRPAAAPAPEAVPPLPGERPGSGETGTD